MEKPRHRKTDSSAHRRLGRQGGGDVPRRGNTLDHRLVQGYHGEPLSLYQIPQCQQSQTDSCSSPSASTSPCPSKIPTHLELTSNPTRTLACGDTGGTSLLPPISQLLSANQPPFPSRWYAKPPLSLSYDLLDFLRNAPGQTSAHFSLVPLIPQIKPSTLPPENSRAMALTLFM